MLRSRLVLLRDLLASTGSIYVHLDWHAAHYVIDPKTVRSYVSAARAAGLVATASEVSDEVLAKTLAELRPEGGRPRGEAWAVCDREREAITACEAAWEFYGGVFHVLKPDNTKAIVTTADPINPRITTAFLEYAQVRGFHVDPARVRSPQDKARVERGVQSVRDDCFGREELLTVIASRERAAYWCEHEYGARRHGTTRRMPKEHFEAVEKAALLPAPSEAYDVPLWCEPKVARDHLAQVAKALYSLPTRLIGKTRRARADRSLVRFYDGDELVKTHARQPPGSRSIDPADFPSEKRAYALRDIDYLARQAKTHGEHVGRLAQLLLEGPLPWTRMRRVYALLSLARRYGDARLDASCAVALKAEMLDVRRLERMLERAAPAPQPEPAQVIPLARYLRPADQYALSLASSEREHSEGEEK